ncbi:hypothetical protein G5B40_18005 [Pikeienuella piscinae]|uniref:Uncharacterized protein n=1 Tax=Pikeienuella piscinae TaxID=2748098 RepID=A0A7M3T585_9RHOB|nr:hypothetical protein [Pikeienuella piscinae]QIE57166.1 hypothetical protein G5B40_18005 [Pikeienuella piscinae]
MIGLFLAPENFATLAAPIAMEVVLGAGSLLCISIVANRLRAPMRRRARVRRG